MRRIQTIEDMAIWTRLALRMPDMMLETASETVRYADYATMVRETEKQYLEVHGELDHSERVRVRNADTFLAAYFAE